MVGAATGKWIQYLWAGRLSSGVGPGLGTWSWIWGSLGCIKPKGRQQVWTVVRVCMWEWVYQCLCEWESLCICICVCDSECKWKCVCMIVYINVWEYVFICRNIDYKCESRYVRISVHMWEQVSVRWYMCDCICMSLCDSECVGL